LAATVRQAFSRIIKVLYFFDTMIWVEMV